MHDSGPGDNRILLFSTVTNLQFMSNCDCRYADGAFHTTPLPFIQLYTIHGVQYSNVISTVNALLSNKTEETEASRIEARTSTFAVNFLILQDLGASSTSRNAYGDISSKVDCKCNTFKILILNHLYFFTSGSFCLGARKRCQ